MGESFAQQSGETGGPIRFPADSMTEYTIKRGNMESVSKFRKLTELMQPRNAFSGLGWIWQRNALKVDKLRNINYPMVGEARSSWPLA